MNRMPVFQSGINVSIICEGQEEFDYINRLKLLNVWSPKYNVEPINAIGNGNIPARYQDKYQNGTTSDIVFVFCDTEKKPYEQYEDIKRKINYFHGKNASDKVVFYGNPCTMQIVIQHWDSVSLKSASKKQNSLLIEEYTGIKNYNAHKDQIEEMMKLITPENYKSMVDRVSKLSNNDKMIGSSNFDVLMKY